jgi:hypothetical protein
MSNKTYRPLRTWASASFDPKTGRAASSLDYGGSFSADGIRINPSSQIDTASSTGEGGARSFGQCDKARTQKHGAQRSED